MTTTVEITSHLDPIEVLVTTDQHMKVPSFLAVGVGTDTSNVDYGEPVVANPVTLTDSDGHQWTLVSDDQGVPTSRLIFHY